MPTAAPSFAGGPNVAMKLPAADHDATVAFYRDTLGLETTEQDVSDAPTVSRSVSVAFGPMTLWLDRVDDLDRAEIWLEVATDDLAAARQRIDAAGVEICDEVEPLPGLGERMHWIRNPAGVVHLLAQGDGGSLADATDGDDLAS